MNNNNNFDRIEKYLFDHLNAEEQTAFEKEMQTNPSLAKEVAKHKMEHRTMQLLRRQELKAKLGEWKAEREEAAVTTNTKRPTRLRVLRNNFRKLAIAASILLLVGFFVQRWADSNFSSQQLVAQNYSLSVSDERGTSDKKLPISLQKAISAMLKKDFDTALNLLNQTKDVNYQETVWLLKGECYLKNKDYDKAVDAYQKVLSTSTWSEHIYQAEWYLLLTYLAADYSDFTTRPLLEKITNNPNHKYQYQAQELEKEMNSFWYKLVN